MARLTPSSLFLLVAGLPPLCTGVLWLGILAIAGLTGQHPIWTLQPRNLSEAAAFQDRAALIRRTRAHEDINHPEEVRAGIIRSTPVTLTPIEAAAASREGAIVQLVLNLGSSPDAGVWQRAYCISDTNEVRAILAAYRPAGATEDCAAQ